MDKSNPPTKLATRFNTNSLQQGGQVIVIPVGRNSTTSFSIYMKSCKTSTA